jgi:hypothetical protein
MNVAAQKACAWAGIVCTVVLGLALWPAAGFLPPLSPADSADKTAAIFREGAGGIRVAAILLLVAAACFAAFTAGISAQIRRIERDAPPALSLLQLLCGGVVTIFFVSMAVNWAAAAYRPERSAEAIQLLNDLSWIWFLFTATVPALQNASFGMAILGDRSADPLLPRWLGYFNLWTAMLFLPGVILPFFKTGPFAWDGIFCFWIPAAVFFSWFFVVAIQLLKAISKPDPVCVA